MTDVVLQMSDTWSLHGEANRGFPSNAMLGFLTEFDQLGKSHKIEI
jgi:hypothetical protein